MTKPIVVSGAGPVGLTAATILSSKGIPVIVLEKENQPSKEWRASTFHAGTLELLEEVGIAQNLVPKGIIADKVQYRDRQTGLYAEFDFNLIKDETNYPYRLQCPQSTYVKMLKEEFLDPADNVELLFNSELTSLEQDKDSVTIKVQTPEGERVIETPYLLAADGARSTTRKLIDYDFTGYTLEEKFLLVGTPANFHDYIPDIAYVNYVSDPEQFLFLLKVPGAWRLLFPVPSNMTDEEATSEENVQKQLQKALKTDDQFEVIEQMIYRVHQRVAEKFYKGRVVLMGDAAHVNSPMGGLGLNSGVHDAVDITRRIERIINEDNESSIQEELETYSDVRRKVALEYVKLISEKNTRLMKEKEPELRVQMQKDMHEEATNEDLARKWILRSSLISSVREQGIGKPPAFYIK